MTLPRIDDLLATCEAAAQAGAEQLLAWRGRFSTYEKAPGDLLTDADLASQQAIREVISQRFPEHGFLAEEETLPEQLEQTWCWVVDPLDGTTNYAHGFPFFAVSVAISREGQVMAGVVLDPLRDECFQAAAGQGARLNGKPLETSAAQSLSEAVVAVSFPPHPREQSDDLRAFSQVAPLSQAVRRTGSAALNLAYVACGRLDAHWAHEIHPWDAAAGVLLVKEAGGAVSNSRGDEFDLARADYLVASSARLHEELVPLVAPASGRP